MSLLDDVIAVLRRESIPHAIIGAAALSAHGVSRSTADIDLLTMEPACLTPSPWTGLSGQCEIDIRRGGADDPLRGVVRFTRGEEMDIDIVVGRHAWQQECVERAIKMPALAAKVVGLPDLVLLKLYAGGPQDAWDVHQILGLNAAERVPAIVEDRLKALPTDAVQLWRRIVAERAT